MGARGPKPKPVTLKVLAGNPGKRPSGPPPPRFTQGCPGKPTWMSKEAGAEWGRIVPELEAAGLLSIADRAALAAYCQAWAELVETTKVVELEGRVHKEPVQNARGEVIGYKLKAHPAVRLQRDAFNRVRQFLVEFGLSPAARGRVGVAGSGAGASDDRPNRLLSIVGRVQDARAKGPQGR